MKDVVTFREGHHVIRRTASPVSHQKIVGRFTIQQESLVIVRYAMLLRSVQRVRVRFYDTAVTSYCCSASTGSTETNVI